MSPPKPARLRLVGGASRRHASVTHTRLPAPRLGTRRDEAAATARDLAIAFAFARDATDPATRAGLLAATLTGLTELVAYVSEELAAEDVE